MYKTSLFTLFSVVVISCLSLICLVTIGWEEQRLRKWMPLVIAVTSGVLLGEAGFHLIPESIANGLAPLETLLLVLSGIIFSFATEKLFVILVKERSLAPVVPVALISETVHNAVDGILIAAAYLLSLKAGIFVTLAIIAHEIPHEAGNFAILIHGGCRRSRAVMYNTLSALASIVGAICVLVVGHTFASYSIYILAPAGGCFIYIAWFDLIPSLRERSREERVMLDCGIAVGLGFMFVMAAAG